MSRVLKQLLWVIPIGFFIACGCMIRMIPGFSFSSWLLWGCGIIVFVYWMLTLLKKKKPKLSKWLLWILSLGLCAVLIAGTVTGIVVGTAAKGDEEIPCDYVIVLGAGVNGTQPSLILSERISRAEIYLREHPDAIAILSGGKGSGEHISEAQCMFNSLTAKGIAPERLWLEDRSTSTRENLRFSMALIEGKTGSRPTRAAIISNEFHLYRAGLFAEEQDLQMVGIPARTTWFSLRANYFLREIVAVWYYTILGG